MTTDSLTNPSRATALRHSLTHTLRRAFDWQLFKATAQEWSRDHASRLAAALAFYTATAFAQLLIGVLAIAGFLYSTSQAQDQLVQQANRFIGAQGGEIVQAVIENADQPSLLRVAGIFSLILLLWSASNIFVQLQTALDTVWGVQLRGDLPLGEKVKQRLLPLLMVAGIGLLVLAATIASAALAAIGNFVTNLLPGGAITWQIINYAISFVVITALFVLIFKELPDVEIAWRDVWPGAALTALLFLVGQLVLGWYLGRQSGSSVYGAAGSLIVLLLWIYYSAQIFLFGAEYTQVYASRYGRGVRPNRDAEPLGSNAVNKPAARAAARQQRGAGEPHIDAQLDHHIDYHIDHRVDRRELDYIAETWQMAADTPQSLGSLGQLVSNLLDDASTLVQQEVRLARVELADALRRIRRGAMLAAGGGLALYAAALLVIAFVVLLLNVIMPLWLAALLIGLLLLIDGWLLTVWARNKLDAAAQRPERSLASLAADVTTVQEHLMTPPVPRAPGTAEHANT